MRRQAGRTPGRAQLLQLVPCREGKTGFTTPSSHRYVLYVHVEPVLQCSETNCWCAAVNSPAKRSSVRPAAWCAPGRQRWIGGMATRPCRSGSASGVLVHLQLVHTMRSSRARAQVEASPRRIVRCGPCRVPHRRHQLHVVAP